MRLIKRLFKYIFKLMLTIVLVVVMGLLAVVGVNGYVRASTKDMIGSWEDLVDFQADCILILGAGVWGTKPSPMLEDRLKTGISLYEKGVSDRLLMSGDHSEDGYDEVSVMKKFAIDAGIPSEHIFMDHAGFSTYESIYRAKDIFLAKKVVIVTQEYHLYRALYIAKKLNVEAMGVSSDLRIYSGQEYRDLRELLARVKDFIYTLFKPLPTYLGDTVSVRGNGDITNDNAPFPS